MEKIIYSPEVEQFLKDLTNLLFEKEYFSYKETAYEYVSSLLFYVEFNIEFLLHKPTPIPLQKFGNFFITYKANANTTWYVLFYKDHEKYLITHIFNSHSKEAQWFNF